jgi:hypothetical protein
LSLPGEEAPSPKQQATPPAAGEPEKTQKAKSQPGLDLSFLEEEESAPESQPVQSGSLKSDSDVGTPKTPSHHASSSKSLEEDDSLPSAVADQSPIAEPDSNSDAQGSIDQIVPPGTPAGQSFVEEEDGLSSPKARQSPSGGADSGDIAPGSDASPISPSDLSLPEEEDRPPAERTEEDAIFDPELEAIEADLRAEAAVAPLVDENSDVDVDGLIADASI